MQYNELCSCCSDNRRKINQLMHLMMDELAKLKEKHEPPQYSREETKDEVQKDKLP